MKVRFFYTVTAVVFGADETLLDIELVNGFNFVKRSLMPLVDHLDTVFETDAMGLRRDYEASVVDKEHLGVICVEKKLSFEIDKIVKPDETNATEFTMGRYYFAGEKTIQKPCLYCEKCCTKFSVEEIKMSEKGPKK